MKKIVTIIVSNTIIFFSSLLIYADNLNEPAWVYEGRGDRYYKNGEIGKAIFEYKKAISKVNNQSGAERSVYPEVSLKLAKIYSGEGLYDLALFQLDVAERNKDFLQIPDLFFEILYTKAEIYFLMKKYNESLLVYESIISFDNNWDSYSQQGIYEISENLIEDNRLKYKFGKAYLEIGKMKYHNNNFENAIPPLKMAMLYKYKWEVTLKYLINCYKKLENKRTEDYLIELYQKKIP